MTLPISKAQAHSVALWMKSHFGDSIRSAVHGTSFTVDHICGIACQETAYFWVSRIEHLTVDEILARCVLDASGDVAGHPRGVFPKNTAEFRGRYGDAFADMLIAEANKTREIRGFLPAAIVYKGYGIFQYDLQAVEDDEAFFREKKWYRFADCLDKVMNELKEKYSTHHHVKEAIRAYNGTGPNAIEYANNVMELSSYCAEINP